MTDCRRDRLPNRRLQSTEVVEWQGQEWLMSVGFNQSGAVRDAFVKGLKTGSAMDAIMDDACVLLSLLLQAGYAASDVDSHLGREGVDSFAPAASPLGLLAQVAATMEREIGDGIRAFHDLSSLNLAGRDGSAVASGSSSERWRSDGVSSSLRCRGPGPLRKRRAPFWTAGGCRVRSG